MTINLNVKIKAGKRTPVQVDAYGTAVNHKILEFANGRSVTEDDICKWIVANLETAIRHIQDSAPKEDMR